MSTAPRTSHETEFAHRRVQSSGITLRTVLVQDLHSIIRSIESGVAHVESKGDGSIWVIEGPETNPVVEVRYRMESSLLIDEGVHGAIASKDDADDDRKPNGLTWTTVASVSPNDASSNCEDEEGNVSSNFERELEFQAASASTSLRQTDVKLKSLTNTELPGCKSSDAAGFESPSTRTDRRLQLSYFNAADELFVVKREIPENELVSCHEILSRQNDPSCEIVQENEKCNQLSSNNSTVDEHHHAVKFEAADNIISCSNLTPNIRADCGLTSSQISARKVVCSVDQRTEDSNLHMGERSRERSFCGDTFNSKEHRTAHERIHAHQRFQCSYCGKTFSQSGHQKSHEKTHTGEKPYECSCCDAKFSTVSNQRRHERTHAGEKLHQCLFCDKKFSRATHKKSHERTHTGDKPYQCSWCDARFSTTTNQRRHARTHTGEKPHQCSFCDKTFSVLASQVSHERTHTGEKPYQCSFCGKKFSRLTYKKSHERTHTRKLSLP